MCKAKDSSPNHVASLRIHRIPRWRLELVGGPPNFFPMGDKCKILFSTIGFSGTGDAMIRFKKKCPRGILVQFGVFCYIQRFLSIFNNISNDMDDTTDVLVTIVMFQYTESVSQNYSRTI